jgi:hypothetical protein
MAWWSWVLIAWVLLALAGAVWLGLALRIAEKRDWGRRGHPDRRSKPRHDAA